MVYDIKIKMASKSYNQPLMRIHFVDLHLGLSTMRTHISSSFLNVRDKIHFSLYFTLILLPLLSPIIRLATVYISFYNKSINMIEVHRLLSGYKGIMM